jgi:hypothetical protein
MAGNVGKVLYLSKQIEDGNFEGAYQAFKQAGDEARTIAEESASQGHKESARQAYLWAQNYYDSSTYFVDNTNDPDRFLPTWELLYDCWLKALSLFEPPIEPISIPYENTELHGFFFKGTSTLRERPLLILNNGSDGSLLDMWTQGYNLEGIAAQIGCPMLITEPVNEAFWPGQSRQLYDLLASPKKLLPFSESDGADLHCEPKGTGLRDLRVFNWLDEILA